MRWLPRSLLLPLVPALLSSMAPAASGCGLRSYVIHPDTARRAAAALREGKHVVVPARDDDGQVVKVSLRDDDSFEVQVREPGKETEYATLSGSELALLPAGAERLVLYHRNRGAPLIGIGGGLLGGGMVIGSLWAIGAEEGWRAIPLYGPLMAMVHADESHDSCEAEGGWFCDLAYLEATLGFIELALEAAGLGLIIAGSIKFEPGREVAGEEDGPTGLRLEFRPMVLGEGQVGGMLGGRF